MNISLRELNRENWETCIQLQPAPDQRKFVAPNVYSLAESKFYENMVPLAIYAGDEMVGFVMHGLDVDDNNYWIYRLMIDQKTPRQRLRQICPPLGAPSNQVHPGRRESGYRVQACQPGR